MKAVVVEIRDDFAAVLSDDGRITTIRNQNYTIGQVMITKKATRKFLGIMPAAAAAVLLLCGAGAYTYAAPYSYVSLDVNPSIEYSLNRFDRVLKVTGVNDDGKDILKEVDLKNLRNQTIDNAIALTVQQIKEDGFFDGSDDSEIVIATSAKDLKKAEELAESLRQSAQDEVDQDVAVESFPVGEERVQKAKELGVTPGKLNLVEKLIESSSTLNEADLENLLNKSVKEIMKEIQQNKKADKEEQKSDAADDENTSLPDSAVSKGASKNDKAESKVDKVESKAESKVEKTEGQLEQKLEKETGNVENQQERAESKLDAILSKSEEKVEKEEAKESRELEKAESKIEQTEQKPDKEEKTNKK